jgi:hypothetical protein
VVLRLLRGEKLEESQPGGGHRSSSHRGLAR